MAQIVGWSKGICLACLMVILALYDYDLIKFGVPAHHSKSLKSWNFYACNTVIRGYSYCWNDEDLVLHTLRD